MQITTKAFITNSESEKQSLELLLRLNSFTVDSFTDYMGASPLDGDKPHQWAINYLRDILETNLIHLGYIFKDTKTDGILTQIKDLTKEIDQIKTTKSIEAQMPFIFNESIVTEQGAIKIAYIANIERILEDFKRELIKEG